MISEFEQIWRPTVNNNKLKKCPFCKKNGNPICYKDSPNGDVSAWDHVVCLTCGSGAPSVTIWNNRDPQECLHCGIKR